MKLEQYEKLKDNVKEASDLITNLKIANRKLKKENEQLKEKYNHYSKQIPGEITGKVNRMNNQNKKLRSKEEFISSRLTHLLGKLKNLTEGVEL